MPTVATACVAQNTLNGVDSDAWKKLYFSEKFLDNT